MIIIVEELWVDFGKWVMRMMKFFDDNDKPFFRFGAAAIDQLCIHLIWSGALLDWLINAFSLLWIVIAATDRHNHPNNLPPALKIIFCKIIYDFINVILCVNNLSLSCKFGVEWTGIKQIKRHFIIYWLNFQSCLVLYICVNSVTIDDFLTLTI